ncbi:hypothetical protein A9G28_09775 [Gilliamella sp. Fer1-1]|jgi:uncharacterized membrane protein YhaH (DUF805 family)|uniref:BRCT domain-containing protein n=1 Tax=Gilliamella sp. Fer1-1 TaxID=3120240 RepID=UPI00080ED297|nr:BRCT domain-containing protein [Gilliamella apicola]OCG39340.1 hypothetical protein A9G28_09775 [Gilliamella apicola]
MKNNHLFSDKKLFLFMIVCFFTLVFSISLATNYDEKSIMLGLFIVVLFFFSALGFLVSFLFLTVKKLITSTNKVVLKFSGFSFLIFCTSILFVVFVDKDNNKFSLLLPSFAIVISFFSSITSALFVAIRFILFKLISKINISNSIQVEKGNDSPKITEQKDTTSSDTINFGTAKLSKSSPEKILKSKVKKAIKADAKKEKKQNPVRSISYIPPTEEEKEKKAKERDRYLKDNFESKLKTLWVGSKDIEFSYSDANDDISYRLLNLNKVLINQHSEIYFSGICAVRDEIRTFKVDRIISTIEYNYHDYSIKQFLTQVLQISNNAGSSRKKSKAKKETFDVHFTGFKQSDKKRLIELAEEKDLTVRKSVTQNLQILCIGYNASQNKIEKAQEMGISIMNESDFLNFLETGEILLGE